MSYSSITRGDCLPASWALTPHRLEKQVPKLS